MYPEGDTKDAEVDLDVQFVPDSVKLNVGLGVNPGIAGIGRGALGAGLGRLKYESSKMSSCEPSRKLYRSLYTGGENAPSNTLFLSRLNQ